MATGTAVATQADAPQQITLKGELERIEPELKNLLPAAIPTPKFMRVVMDALNRNPDLKKCTPRSVVDACMKAAADGLVLDGREAALVSYARREKQGIQWVTVGYDATYIPMVAGIRKRVFNSGLVSALVTGIVYENELAEHFDYQEGTEAYLRHKPLLTGELGDPAVVYSVVTMKDGTRTIEVMRWSEVMKIARRSPKNYDKDGLKGIWKSDTNEMARKTVMRRHSKQLPFNSDTAQLFERMDDLYADETGETHEGEIAEPEPTTRKRAGTGAARLRAAKAAEMPPHDPHTGEILENGAEYDPGPEVDAGRAPASRDDDRF